MRENVLYIASLDSMRNINFQGVEKVSADVAVQFSFIDYDIRTILHIATYYRQFAGYTYNVRSCSDNYIQFGHRKSELNWKCTPEIEKRPLSEFIRSFSYV